MELQGRIVTVIYDEKRYRFNTTQIEGLNINEDKKFKLKEMFDVLSKNRTYIRLLDSTTPKAAIIMILVGLLLSIIFLIAAVRNTGPISHIRHSDESTSKTTFNEPIFYDNDTKYVSASDVNKEVSRNSNSTPNDEEDDQPQVGDPGDPGDLNFRLGLLSGYSTNKWRRKKDAFYWVLFIIILIITISTVFLFILYQIRQRRLYQSLEKYELDMIGDYMSELRNTFMIKRMHKKRIIFKYLKCLFAFKFAYEVRTVSSSHRERPQITHGNDYNVDTETGLNVTSEMDYSQYDSRVYEFKDGETKNLAGSG